VRREGEDTPAAALRDDAVGRAIEDLDDGLPNLRSLGPELRPSSERR